MDISTENRIDDYLLGRMTPEQKTQFEADIKSDPELKAEYEAQLDTALGVQRLALKQFLSECEEQRKSKGKVRSINFRARRIIYSVGASAAVVIAVCTGGAYRYASLSDSLQTASVLSYDRTIAPTPRDGNALDILLDSAYVSLGAGELDKAETQIAEAKALIAGDFEVFNSAEHSLTEEEVYELSLLKMKAEDAEWYSALVLMKRGKVFKAQKTLKAIAKEGGTYAGAAEDILSEVYHF